MAIYGFLMEDFNESENQRERVNNDFSSMTESDLNQFAIDLIESYDLTDLEEYVSTLDEGANIDMTDAMRAHFENIRNNIKSAKTKIKKNRDPKGAKADLDKAKNELKQLETKIKKADSDIISVICGYFASGLVNSAQLLIPLIACCVVGPLPYFIESIILLVRAVKQFVKDIKDKNTSTVDALNLYRNKMLQFCTQFQKQIDKVQRYIDNASQA